MTTPIISLQRLAKCKKTMRVAAAVAIWSLAAPAYSSGLKGLAQGIADRTTLFLYAESNGNPVSPMHNDKSGVATIVYSPMAETNRGIFAQSAARSSQVSNSLDGRYLVTDLMLARDYTHAAAKKKEKTYGGMTSGAIIGWTMIALGVGIFAWKTNDDGNAND